MRQELVWVDKQKALAYFGFTEEFRTVLVMGGSQGSRRINEACIKTLSSLKDTLKVQVIHLSGEADAAELRRNYATEGIKAVVFSFLEQMQYAYSAADLVISRAGASAITETIAFKIPALIIPYPFARAHQLANAQVLKPGCAVVVQDRGLDTGEFADALADILLSDSFALMRQAYGESKVPSASYSLVDVALTLQAG